jgi:hypothetical protein
MPIYQTSLLQGWGALPHPTIFRRHNLKARSVGWAERSEAHHRRRMPVGPSQARVGRKSEAPSATFTPPTRPRKSRPPPTPRHCRASGNLLRLGHRNAAAGQITEAFRDRFPFTTPPNLTRNANQALRRRVGPIAGVWRLCAHSGYGMLCRGALITGHSVAQCRGMALCPCYREWCPHMAVLVKATGRGCSPSFSL